MKILICGGHLTPALAVIKKLPKDTEIVYIGRKHALEGDSALSLEYQVINKLGIQFIDLKMGRLQRHLSKHTLKSLFKIGLGFFNASKIINAEKPDIILGFGSYISLPLGIMAARKKIPLIIHEQTFQVGLTNKILSKFAKKICVSWESSFKYFPKNKTILTGNPVLEEYFTTQRHSDKAQNADSKIKKLVFVGGSLGSHFMNNLVIETLPKLGENYEIFHQTGDAKEFNDFEKLEKIKNNLPPKYKNRYRITKFIDPSDVKEIFQNADIIISRAGVNTVSALLVLEKPAILIPIPFNKSDQMSNATFFKNSGLGIVLDQEKLRANDLLETINNFSENINKYKSNLEDKFLEIHKTAAENVIEVLKSVANI